MPWKRSSLLEYEVGNEERQEQLSIYRARTQTLNVVRKSCIELRIILYDFTLQINVHYRNWHLLSNNEREDCFFPTLPPLEGVLDGERRLSGWTRQVLKWADNQDDFADATKKAAKKAADINMGRTG
ncbi:predicted protein [Sclerotinia sclerotiorum 1980 UF-70]|uniref:Uncharacterized protein n=2 Tax=Sclerotinia sclerotiorum (strain ATCC 18683 / 1980 / Ss-1) TaxID=665079 RepID=A7F9N1_SCLS1|nr:predicted protein [Sclerotinia sclerotiorum 1980 UF-70]APA16342.1 hypothetical protein sscle_16g111120 [Sclerotinia sclerotiorum 1980 UF-70]EDO00442.1 predicted protein [Sclerotinia sclerotiorum 1980 UF-70]